VKESLMSLSIPQRYSGLAIFLHWAVAILIIVNLIIALLFDSLPKSVFRPFLDLHKSFGITVLGLVILRLLWRAIRKPPPFPAGYRPWEKSAAHIAHWVLYGLAFLVPFTGWLHDSAWKDAATHPMKLYWVIPFFRFGFIENLDPATKESLHSTLFQIHESLAYVILAMLVVHVAGALKHQFIDKEPELQRMGIGR
jgi:cytochrome b561